MTKRELLLHRLDQIAGSLAGDPRGVALIGLGSCGAALHRLDDYSDLDFFAIVTPDAKASMVAELDWLEGFAPVAYRFRNTADGYKLMYEDGVFCEFAVFTPSELAEADYADARVIWGRDDFTLPERTAGSRPERTKEWLVGEAITNLYVGLGRYLRGERQSACRFVQGYAVDRVIDLAMGEAADRAADAGRDPFAPERRIEVIVPDLAATLGRLQTGYDATPAAALAVLEYLEESYDVNATMARLIRELAERS